MTNRTRGFTLVEALVVLAVIATLLALVLPALRASRESGRQAVCMSNVRSIGLAIEMYRNEHKDLYPYADRLADLENDYLAPYDALEAYLSSPVPRVINGEVNSGQPYRCPSDKTNDPWAGFSYAYRPYDLMMAWSGPNPQQSVSRVLDGLSQEIIILEGAPRHKPSKSGAYRNDGTTLMLSRDPNP